MLRAGDIIVFCVVSLLCIGMVMVNSAGLSVGGTGDPITFWSIVLSRSALYALAAVTAMVVVSRLPLRALLGRGLSGLGLLAICAALGAACLLVYVPGLGREINGAHRWIGFPLPGGDVTVQPSELAKWGILIALAARFAGKPQDLRPFLKGLLPALACLGLVTLIVVREDLGTAVIIGVAGVAILLAAGARLWHFLAMTPIAAAGLVVAVLSKPYRVQRLTSFLDPFKEPEGAGYHMIQSMVAVANGRIWGRGLGFGLQKFDYLPADTSDFLFAIICEELGLIGAAMVIALYLTLFWAGWRIVRREPSIALRLAGLGIIATVGSQAVMNLAVVTGLGPTKGIALPLLSSGGTGWILTAASLGVLVGMDRRQGRLQGPPDRHEIAEPKLVAVTAFERSEEPAGRTA